MRQLRASCYPPVDHKGPFWSCDALPVEKTEIARLCSPFRVITPEPADWREKGYETISIPDNPECKIPWVRITVIRKSPGGNDLEISAHFLPNKWLREHPEADKKIERPPPVNPTTVEPTNTNDHEDASADQRNTGHAERPESKPGQPILRTATPVIDGALESTLVLNTIRPIMRKLLTCYAPDKSRPGRASRVNLHWIITPKGRTKGVEIYEEDVGDAKVLRCLRRQIEQTRFPAVKRGKTEVIFPFIFTIAE
jgi:hypothetical protein